MPAPGEHHPAFEEYCECIFELAEDDVDIIQARIADRLEVSRPAVSEMIRKLESVGLITNDGKIKLTSEGQQLAERVVRRHRLAERFLTDMDQQDALNRVWADYFGEAKPATTTVQVVRLATDPRCLIEINAIAVID